MKAILRLKILEIKEVFKNFGCNVYNKFIYFLELDQILR